MKRLAVVALLLVARAAPAVGAEYERLPAILHVHSDLSTGDFALEELLSMAERAGIHAILLAENYLLRVEYSLPPFRALTRVVYEERSVLAAGVTRYLERVAVARARNPRVLIVPGVEVLPHYQWTGSPLALDMTVHNTQKNLLVFGVTDPAALRSLPGSGNPSLARFTGSWWVELIPGLLLIPGGMAFATKRRRLHRVGRAVVLVRRRRWLTGAVCCAVGVAALVRAWPFGADPYPPYEDLGLAPHQDLIDYVDRLGGVTVWSLPEARDSGERRFGPVRVAWRTDPYPDTLLRTTRYTAFGAVYEDTTRVELPGGGWDRLLGEHISGRRGRPVWAVGESAFHGLTAGKGVGPLQTVFLVAERSERGILEAFKHGRMYALRQAEGVGLALGEFSVSARGARAVSGETLSVPAGTAIEIRVGLEAPGGGARDARVTLVRNGTVVGAWAGPTPFRRAHREIFDGAPAYFRLDARGPGRLLSNPIFVRRP